MYYVSFIILLIASHHGILLLIHALLHISYLAMMPAGASARITEMTQPVPAGPIWSTISGAYVNPAGPSFIATTAYCPGSASLSGLTATAN